MWPPGLLRKSNKWSQMNSQHSRGHTVPCGSQATKALPLMLPITKLITSFLCDCLTYKDVMDLLEELSLWLRVEGELIFMRASHASLIPGVAPHCEKGDLQMWTVSLKNKRRWKPLYCKILGPVTSPINLSKADQTATTLSNILTQVAQVPTFTTVTYHLTTQSFSQPACLTSSGELETAKQNINICSFF